MRGIRKNLDLSGVYFNLLRFHKKVDILERISHENNHNLSHKINLDGKESILKIYNRGNKECIKRHLEIQKYFHDNGLLCQKVLSFEDKFLFEDPNFYYSLLEFIPGDPIQNASREDFYKILDTLTQFHSIGEGDFGELLNLKEKMPPIEEGKYKQSFIDLLEIYEALKKVKPNNSQVIHGDAHLGQILKSSNGEIYILDFETVTHGDPLEDIANFVFYSLSNRKKCEVTPGEVYNYFLNKNPKIPSDNNLSSYIKKVAIKQTLGGIWEFNHGLIDNEALNKRFKSLERVNNLSL